MSITRRAVLGIGAAAAAGGLLFRQRGSAVAQAGVISPSLPATVVTPSPEPIASPTMPTSMDLAIDSPGWWSWSLTDRVGWESTGSTNVHEVNLTCSMFKAWIVADFLRQRDPSAAEQDILSRIIRDSLNDEASEVFAELGRSACVERMIDICGLVDTNVADRRDGVRMSARDATRLALRIGDGSAAGPKWTEWLLSEMRQVRGDGDFGIRQVFAEPQRGRVAIKNGWDTFQATSEWRVNCLAVTEKWALSVLTRYPVALGRDHGIGIAESVTRQLLERGELRAVFG